ncbi:MAG: hypothetical protein QXY18_00975 [Nitrososphaerota archaeon]
MKKFNYYFPTIEKQETKSTKSYYCSVKCLLYKALPTYTKVEDNKVSTNLKTFQQKVNSLNKITKQIAEIYSSKSRLTSEEWLSIISTFLDDFLRGIERGKGKFLTHVDFNRLQLKATIISQLRTIKNVNSEDVRTLENFVSSSIFSNIWAFLKKILIDFPTYGDYRIEDTIPRQRLTEILIEVRFGKHLLGVTLFDSLKTFCEKYDIESDKNVYFVLEGKSPQLLPELKSLGEKFLALNNQIRGYLQTFLPLQEIKKLEERKEKLQQELKEEQVFYQLSKYKLNLSYEDVFKFDLTSFLLNINSTFTLDSNISSDASISLVDAVINPLEYLCNGFLIKNEKSNEFFKKLSKNIPLVNYEDPSLIASTQLSLHRLIQPMDYMVIYVYNDEVPIEEKIKLERVFLSKIASSYSIEIKNDLDFLNYEIFLEYLGFNSIFSGFVHDLTYNFNVGSIPTVTLTCKGPLHFLSTTARIFTPGLAQKVLYDLLEVGQQLDLFSVLQNIYMASQQEGQKENIFSLREIILTLLSTVFLITVKNNPKLIDLMDSTTKKKIKTLDLTKNLPVLDDILNLNDIKLVLKEYNDEVPAEGFPLANFLLGIVKFEQGFQVDVLSLTLPKNKPTYFRAETKINYILNELKINKKPFLKISEEFLEPVKLRGYFIYLRKSLSNYTPTLKSPKDIISELQPICFFEFFEHPDGSVVFRPLYYNKAPQKYLDNYLNLTQSFSFTLNTSRVKTRFSTAFEVDIIGQLMGFINFPYSDGKLLYQYGFRDGGVIRNPNIKYQKVNDWTSLSSKYHKYSQFYLMMQNFKNQSGRISGLGQLPIFIGDIVMFSSLKPNEFYIYQGYVTNESYSLQAGSSFTKNLVIEYVRPGFVPLPEFHEFFKEE